MHIIILGAGLTGTQLARRLIQEKHDVSLIDSNEERVRHASNRLDCIVLQNEGNIKDTLEEAGIAKADALVCVTNSDEVNLIICGLVDSWYPGKLRRLSDAELSTDLNAKGARRMALGLMKIARVKNDEYVHLKQYANKLKGHGDSAPDNNQAPKIMGVNYFVHPAVEAAHAVLRAMSHGAVGNILDFTGTSFEMGSINIVEGSAFDGLNIKDYRSIVKEDSLVIMVERKNGAKEECIIPSGTTVLTKGDHVHILARETLLEKIFRLAGSHEKPLRNIGIVGGGHVSTLIAEEILNHDSDGETGARANLLSVFKSIIPSSKRRVLIIERDYTLCKELSARFPQALVLNEDISDESFIAEDHIGDLDLIITATDNHESNIIAAVYLKTLGVRRAIALVSGSGQEAIARQLGVDVVVPLRSVVVDSIHSKLMDRGVREVQSLGDGNLQIYEVEISANAHVAGKSISEFRLSEGGLIMLVSREEESFIPRGDYVFSPGDKLVFMAKKESEAELEKYFGVLRWRAR